MIRSYDFLIRAYRVLSFREEIIRHINLPTDSEMIYDFAILKFDYDKRVIKEYPNIGVFLANKVFPMEISYDAFFQIMDNKGPWFICEKECKLVKQKELSDL